MIARRELLAGPVSAGVLAALFDPHRGHATGPPPLRFLIFAHLNPHVPAGWRPAGEDTLGDATRPLEPWRSRLLIIDGLRSLSAEHSPALVHAAAVTALLTGTADTARRRGDETNVEAGSPSIDQHLAPRLRGPARLASAEVTVSLNCREPPNINYGKGGGRALPYLGTPEAAFNRFFAGALGARGGAATAAEAASVRHRRASVLDHLAGELGALARRLGKEDAGRITAHLDEVRDMERQLMVGELTCDAGPRPATEALAPSRLTELTRLQLDLIVHAFACDVTRVVTFANGDSSWNTPAAVLGLDQTPHDIAHGLTPHDPQVVAPQIMRWSYEQLAYLLRALQSVPEGHATLLDSTLVLSLSEFGDAITHSHKNLPVIVVGNAHAYLHTGRRLDVPRSHADLLVTLANALGDPIPSFGDPRYCEGPIEALRA